MPDQALQQMDEAAAQAGEELKSSIDGWSARDLAQWWSRWYLKAGHKRLGRLVVDVAKRGRQS